MWGSLGLESPGQLLYVLMVLLGVTFEGKFFKTILYN